MKCCPHCHGKKEVFAFLNTGVDWRNHRQEMIPCILCGGFGEITEEHANRIDVGRKKRSERVASGESLMDAANRLGITASQLSAIENSREYE